MIKCDLHNHSICSDGRFTPKEVIKLAKDTSLNFIALTDHDTVSGLDEAFIEAKNLNINFVPGIELSTEYKGKSIHVLGFFTTDAYKDKEFISFLDDLKEKRISRAYKIVENLKKFHNINLDINKVLENGKDTIARPHIAKAIIDAGYNYDFEYIFNNLIGNNCPAYVPSTKISTEEGIKILKKYNALVFLAHPVLIKNIPLDEVLNLGFDGLEAVYYRNTEEDTINLLDIAKEKKLYISCGSDCHGIPNDIKHGNIGDIITPSSYDISSLIKWLDNFKS